MKRKGANNVQFKHIKDLKYRFQDNFYAFKDCFNGEKVEKPDVSRSSVLSLVLRPGDARGGRKGRMGAARLFS